MAIDTSLSVQYLRPLTPQDKISDEQTESVALKAREQRTGKDAAVPVPRDAAAPASPTAAAPPPSTATAPEPAAGSQTVDVRT